MGRAMSAAQPATLTTIRPALANGAPSVPEPERSRRRRHLCLLFPLGRRLSFQMRDRRSRCPERGGDRSAGPGGEPESASRCRAFSSADPLLLRDVKPRMSCPHPNQTEQRTRPPLP